MTTELPQSDPTSVIEDNINLQVGDIINITAPSDTVLDNQIFLIKYIDTNKITILGRTKTPITLIIDENGDLQNESIESIGILSRTESPSYARQNGLIPEQWIDIHFNTEIPTVITGQIDALEEDQIEIKLTPGETIYIDFAYKGIPEDIPIEKIVLRGAPTISKDQPSIEDAKEELEYADNKEDAEDKEAPVFKERIKDIILAADQIQFGDELEKVPMVVEVPESEKRYSIEQQTTDLLNDLLANIPNNKRTQSVLNNIHKMIERFKYLRKEFSIFDKYGHALSPKKNGSDYKPLIGELNNFDKKLYWLLPVVKNKKKIYDVSNLTIEQIMDLYSDVEPETLAASRIEEHEIMENYNSGSNPDGQNGYDYMTKKINNLWTPFTKSSNLNLIANKYVNTNLTTITDNIDNFYSSVSNGEDIKRHRYLMQDYTTNLNTIKTTKVRGGADIVSIKPITKADEMQIKSFISLPKSIVHFSNVNILSSNMLIKSNLSQNFLMYGKLLNKRTNVSILPVDENNLNFEDINYLKDIIEYLPDEDEKMDYDSYLNKIIPKTRTLFNLIKNDIKDGFSLYKTITNLEPFLIYTKDLSYKQYQDINDFVKYKINIWKRIYTQKKQLYYSLLTSESVKITPNIFTLVNGDTNMENKIKENYNLELTLKHNLSNNEFLIKINNIDYGKYFNDVIALLSRDLMLNTDISSIENIKTSLPEPSDDTCKPRILSKKYIALDELEADNGRQIKFDKIYDKTYYDVIDEYMPELNLIATNPEKIIFLTKKLMLQTGMSENEAAREAEALLNKYRLVNDGDYAILVVDDKNHYYKRKDNTWIKDVEINENIDIEDNKLFCNISNKCITVNDDCLDLKDAKIKINNDILKDLNNEYDNILNLNAETIDKLIINNTNNSESRINSLILLNNNKFLQYNNYKYEIGAQSQEVIIPDSPHSKLLSLILEQSDFVKRQNDISKFVSYYTRPSSPLEDKWWLYCNQTDVKILPTFVSKLADVFIKDNSKYLLELENIKIHQGEINGADIVDKYSGWLIGSIELSNDEGYDEQGFVIRTRDLIQEDLGSKIGKPPKDVSSTQYDDPNTIHINNVVQALSRFLGVNMESQENFIISQSIHLINSIMPTKKDYDEVVAKAQAKGKKRDSYEIAFNQNLIIITISYLLIAIQTSIPSLNTKKTYPGCVKSFDGYPTFSKTNKTGIEYIACVTNSIKKSSSLPWISLKKLNTAKIATKMEKIINNFIIDSDIFKQRKDAKEEYKLTNKDEFIPKEHKIENWNTFLPPLRLPSVSVEQLSGEFKKNLLKNIRSGDSKQFKQINTLRAKIIYNALSIEQHIEDIIVKNLNDNSAILSNNVDIPYLENACCSDSNDNTYDYFVSKNNNIQIKNDIIGELSNILEDLGSMATAPILFNPEDTRVDYPKLSPEFGETTIYKAFIVFCKYNINIPIDPQLQEICMEKPDDFNINESIQEKINVLRSHNRNYDNKALEQLMSIVNKNNIVHIPIHKLTLSNIQRLRQTLEHYETTDIFLPADFFKNMLTYLDQFGSQEISEDNDTRNIKNYLAEENKKNLGIIENFIKKNTKSNKKEQQKLFDCLHDITSFKPMENKDNIFIMANYMKNTIELISKVYPNIIINDVNYSNIKIPPQWNLSDIHQSDIKKQSADHFKALSQFYEDDNVKRILHQFQIDSASINDLMIDTMYLSPINEKFSIFNESIVKLLFSYYFYNTLALFISLINREDIYLSDVQSNEIDVVISKDDDSILEIISGEKKNMSTKIASIISAFLTMVCNTKKNINFNYEDLMEKVTKSKEKEKNMMVEFLTNLTDEQREIENLFKNFRMGEWSVGLQKGYREYDADTYDKERKAIEERTLLENKIKKKDDVTEGLMDIYALDAIQEDITNEEIEHDELMIEYTGEDNNIDDDNYDDDM